MAWGQESHRPGRSGATGARIKIVVISLEHAVERRDRVTAALDERRRSRACA